MTDAMSGYVHITQAIVYDLARYNIMNWMKPASPLFDFSAANTHLFGNQAVSWLLGNPRERTQKHDIREASSEDPLYETRAVPYWSSSDARATRGFAFFVSPQILQTW